MSDSEFSVHDRIDKICLIIQPNAQSHKNEIK